MSIIEKLRQSVEGATGLPFYYDTPQTLNIRLERGIFPAAMLHILQSNALTDTNGIIRERLTIEMLFVTTSRSAADALDFDGAYIEQYELDALKHKAFQWLLSVLRSHELRLISINSTNRYYATDDAIYSAYGVNVTIEEVQGVTSCDF